MATPPSVVSLFSGAGGLDIGLERAGWRTLVTCDIDPAAAATLRASKAALVPIDADPSRTYLDEARILHEDVNRLSAADFRPRGVRPSWRPDLLAGGPPCQPWSSAGLQKGFEDDRGLLIGKMLKVADELRPRYVLMENVRGLLTACGPRGEHGEAIRIIQHEWERLGYAVSWALLNAADYGAAQRRVRLVMLASADHRLPTFPEPTHARDGDLCRKPWVSLGELLRSCPKPDPADVVVPTGLRERELLALSPGTGIRTGGVVEHQRPGGHWGYRQDCFLADLSLPSRTIRAASTPDWIRPRGGLMRRLTWRECAALQGFPSQWVFEGQRDAKFRLVGNAVQTHMATAVGVALLGALRMGPTKAAPASPPWPEYFARRIRGAAADHRANVASRVRHLERRAS